MGEGEAHRQKDRRICPGGGLLDDFAHGERYIKSHELARNFIESMPITDIPAPYVVFKPLRDVHVKREVPVVVIFLANPDQLSALVILANYAREGNEHAIVPFAAGCETIGIFAYREAQSERQRAIIELRIYRRGNTCENSVQI